MTKLASMAKLKAGRLARELVDSCLQYWGGMGFTSDVLISRFYRSVPGCLSAPLSPCRQYVKLLNIKLQ